MPFLTCSMLRLLTLALAVLLPETARAQNHLYTFNGDSTYILLGASVSGAGDVNKDGYADVIVGVPYDSKNGRWSGKVIVLSGRDGRILHTFHGKAAFYRLGAAVSGAGDVDKDGYADVMVGAFGSDQNGPMSGSAYVLSGKDGKLLYAFHGDSAYDFLGVSVSNAGDVNGDGYPDFIVGAYGDDDNGTDSGSARVLSGRDGKILHTFRGDSRGDLFGISVSSAGDVDKDGFADLIVGAHGDDNNGNDSGSAPVFSGKNGKVLYTFIGDSAGDWFGRSVSGAGDVDKDGYADVVVGAFQDDVKGQDSGSARVLSGRTGKTLCNFYGDSAGDLFGVSVSNIGDVNKDGYPDLVVGAMGDSNRGKTSGSARVLSGRNGRILYTFNGNSTGDLFGVSVSGAGDVNKDGYPDLIVGAWHDDNNGAKSGSATVFSGTRLMLTADTHILPLSKGGVQNFTLDTGRAQAGKLYVMLGSVSGTMPGIKFGAVTLPLNLDVYFGLLAANPNTIIIPSLAFLDSSGKASAKLALPSGLDSRLAGSLLHHAYLVIGLNPLSFDIASNPVPLTLVR